MFLWHNIETRGNSVRVQETYEMDAPSPLIQRMEMSPDILTVHWRDGGASRFHAIWLRDNAPADALRDPSNGQRLIDVTDLPDRPVLSSAVLLADGSAEIAFEDGFRCAVPAAWLKAHAYDPAPAPGWRPKLWDRRLAGDLPAETYGDVKRDPLALRGWLTQVRDYGFALLTGAPTEEGMVCRVAELFGYVRETNYGRLFDVRSVEKPNNLAFTGRGLMVHTDNPYRDPVPGLQLLHCLESEADGGESVVVDGFMAAEMLRRERPEAFDLLTRHHVPFRFRDGSADLQARAPLIETDDRGLVIAVRYNNRSIAPPDLPFEAMTAWYEAYRAFAGILGRRDLEVGFKLGPGDLFIVDNRRVLHGRKAYGGARGGRRHLQGCYADRDALLSRIRVLEERDA